MQILPYICVNSEGTISISLAFSQVQVLFQLCLENKQPFPSHQRLRSHRGDIKGRLTNKHKHTHTLATSKHTKRSFIHILQPLWQKLEHLIFCESCNQLPVTIKFINSAQGALCHNDTKINHYFCLSPHVHISPLQRPCEIKIKVFFKVHPDHVFASIFLYVPSKLSRNIDDSSCTTLYTDQSDALQNEDVPHPILSQLESSKS